LNSIYWEVFSPPKAENVKRKLKMGSQIIFKIGYILFAVFFILVCLIFFFCNKTFLFYLHGLDTNILDSEGFEKIQAYKTIQHSGKLFFYFTLILSSCCLYFSKTVKNTHTEIFFYISIILYYLSFIVLFLLLIILIFSFFVPQKTF
jgi:hypothetical protein